MHNLEPCEFYSLHCEPASFWSYLLISLTLVVIAGVMSGLTVGMLSLDFLNLRILEMEGTEVEKARAAKVLPVIRKHHFLLVAMVLINAIANEALPIFLSKLVPESVSIIISVTCVLFFGEIVPQAIFTGPRQLKIVAALTPLVQFLMAITSPIAYPIAKLLDWWLGASPAAVRYKRQEIKALVALQRETDAMRQSLIESSKRQTNECASPPYYLQHTDSGDAPSSFPNDPSLMSNNQLSPHQCAQSTKLHVDEVTIIHGALDLSAKTVRSVMIPIDRVFMLEYNTKLDDNVLADILASGHSRIPIYQEHPSNIVGMLLVKRLIVVDPADERPVHELALRKPIVVRPEESCYNMLNEFQKGRSHIALVTNDVDLVIECWQKNIPIPKYVRFEGILTIEDVIEELIQEEIEDESDRYGQDIIKMWKKQVSRKYYPSRVPFVQRRLKQLAEQARRRVRNRHEAAQSRAASSRMSHLEVNVIATTAPLLHDSTHMHGKN